MLVLVPTTTDQCGQFRNALLVVSGQLLVVLPQVIVAGVGDDWEGARRDISSPLHILTPTMLDLQVKNSLMDDAKLPK